MKVPIRVMGMATTFFWMFLIAFFVSAVYSVKDLHFNLGEPQMGLTADNNIVVSLPITITNDAFYNIGSFSMATEISEKDGFVIANATTFIPIIEKSETVTAARNMTVNFTSLLENNSNFLFNDTELQIYVVVGMKVAEIIPVQASTNLSVPWGAPLYNFMIGEPEYSHFNLTHFLVILPISFENHAFFDVVGNIQVQMYNNADVLVGFGQTAIDAPQHTLYNGFVEFYIRVDGVTPTGFFEVNVYTPTFSCESLRFPYG
ncbi:MAG: hypothetical protein QW270_05090 [Candidatus Bathyarchaeia archaeon]